MNTDQNLLDELKHYEYQLREKLEIIGDMRRQIVSLESQLEAAKNNNANLLAEQERAALATAELFRKCQERIDKAFEIELSKHKEIKELEKALVERSWFGKIRRAFFIKRV